MFCYDIRVEAKRVENKNVIKVLSSFLYFNLIHCSYSLGNINSFTNAVGLSGTIQNTVDREFCRKHTNNGK